MVITQHIGRYIIYLCLYILNNDIFNKYVLDAVLRFKATYFSRKKVGYSYIVATNDFFRQFIIPNNKKKSTAKSHNVFKLNNL